MSDDSKSGPTVPVMTPTPAPGPYTYAAAAGTDPPPPGDIVAVPLGPRLVPAIVWDGPAGKVEARKLRAIDRVFDCPPVAAPMRRFIDWLADYTLSPPGMVARMALRAPAAFDPEPALEGIAYTGGTAERLTP
ncbi:MAG: primosomal protein N', partial [Rhizobiaceae bacterium]